MAIQCPPVKYDAFRMEGGLDLVTPTLSLKPGVARDALNFEISVTGGYTRINGYERLDGRPAPSAAGYGVVTLSSVGAVAVGNTINNAAVTKSGVVIAISGLNLIFTKSVGSFLAGDILQVGATVIGTVQATSSFTADVATQALYTYLAAEQYRADITVVPGSGPIRGVVQFNSVIYAWRNTADASAMAIYKSSAAGWVLVPLGRFVKFNTGALGTIVEGDTITDTTTSGTAVVSRVMLESGSSWSGGSGKLILSSVTGTIGTGHALQVGGTTRATSTTADAAITLAPNGRVQTIQGTFGSNVGTRVFGCDNVNPGFEFDGVVYAPITTGMATDKPRNVVLHKNYLFFSFGASVQNSGIGTPYVWSPVFGANEFVLPETVTALMSMPGTVASGALAVFTRNNTYMLYGTGLSTWNLVPFNAGVGGAAYTAQTMENAYALDDRGVVSMQTSLNFGNFDSSTLTLAIRPFIQARRMLATASGLNREKSQYRIFYNDGYGLYITIVNGQVRGSMPVQFPDPVFCWGDAESSNGTEISFFGGSLGYVYKLDSGTSFDGAGINSSFTLNYDTQGSTRVMKRYRRASLEVTGTGYAAFDFGYSLGYGSTSFDQASASPLVVPFSPSFWDGMTWDTFIFDGRNLTPSEAPCNGTAENIALVVASNSKISQSFTINSAVLHYSMRRGIR